MYQELIDKLKAEFPGYSVEIRIDPRTYYGYLSMITIAGRRRFDKEYFDFNSKPTSFDDAILALKQRIKENLARSIVESNE